MSIVIDDPRLEQLAQQLAVDEGITVESVVRDSLLFRADRRRVTTVNEWPLRERSTDFIAREVDLPEKVPTDRRTAEEILDYYYLAQW